MHAVVREAASEWNNSDYCVSAAQHLTHRVLREDVDSAASYRWMFATEHLAHRVLRKVVDSAARHK